MTCFYQYYIYYVLNGAFYSFYQLQCCGAHGQADSHFSWAFYKLTSAWYILRGDHNSKFMLYGQLTSQVVPPSSGQHLTTGQGNLNCHHHFDFCFY